MNLEHILSKKLFNQSDLVAVYPYGSRVYGTAGKKSDYDYIIVLNVKENPLWKSAQYSDTLMNINFYSADEHQQRIADHEISALECFFLPQSMVLYDVFHPLSKKSKVAPFKFKLDLPTLRSSLSAKSSNSWVKAKKKLTVEKDYDIDLGRKSLFHSMRVIDFGIQIAESGAIHDYGSCNDLFREINQCYSWGELFLRYKQRYNHMLSKFKKVAPKELVK